MPRSPAVFAACVVLAACSGPPAAPRAPSPSPPAAPSASAVSVAAVPRPGEGVTDLPSGARVRWRYDFDRNALTAMKVAGGAVVALTASGNLLRFDLATLKLTAERVGPGVVRSLGSGPDGAVLAGLAVGPLGRVVRVDPETLALTPLVEVDAPPVWVGADDRGVWAVVERLSWRQERAHGGRDFRVRDATYEAVDFASQSRVRLHSEGTTFLLDRKHRLWIGGNYGEFGSSISVVDFTSKVGSLVAPAGKFEGVYGFFERGDEVFAYGGSSHMASSRGYVARCTDARVTKVANFYWDTWSHPEPDRSRPFAPVTHLFAGGAGGELLALSSGALFRVNPSFSQWTRLRDVEVRDGSGRRAAVHSNPGVKVVLRGDDGRLLAATRHDGLVRLAGKETERAALPAQLEAGRVDDIAGGPEGAILLGAGSAWARAGGGWGKRGGVPSGASGRAAPGGEAGLLGLDLHVEPDGALVTVARLADTPPDEGFLVSPDRLVVARWRGGAGAIVAETKGGEAQVYNTFRTPDGALWGTTLEHLVRFEAGAWKPVVALPQRGVRMKVVGAGGPPWVLLEANQSRLFRLDPARGALDPVAATDQAGELPIEDALPWANGGLLLATWRGLYELPAAGGVAVASRVAAPADVFRLTRDAQGRLWLGGEGIWVHDLAKGRLHVLDEAPAAGRRSVAAIAPDPARPGGVVVAFDNERESSSGGASVAFLAIDPD
jgi:hypothetical protein